jgi:hypothetical protein
MVQKIYLPKSLGIYNPPRKSGIFGTAIDTDTLDVADWITQAASDGTITISGVGAVSSVAGRTGAVTLAKVDVGLTNVDDTSDANKPVSIAQATAIGLKANSTVTDNLTTLSGVAANATNLGTFTGVTIPDNATVKSALAQLEAHGETLELLVAAKQDKIQYKQAGTNVSTLGAFDKINVIGGTAVINGGDATQLDITIPSVGATTNTLTSNLASGIVSTVNGIVATLTPPTGTIATQLGFDGTGAIVKALPVASAPITVVNNGASIKYFVVSGTPVVTFTKAAGVTQVVSTGGLIEVIRVQVGFDTATDTDGANSITVQVPTTQSGSMIQVPVAEIFNTQNGATPSVTPWLYKNPGSTPTLSVSGGTAGSFVIVKATGTNVLGTTATLVMNF